MPDPDLPPELARLRRIDEALHRSALKQAGLPREQAERHTRAEMRERDALLEAELQGPGKPLAPNVPDESGKPGKARRAQESEAPRPPEAGPDE